MKPKSTSKAPHTEPFSPVVAAPLKAKRIRSGIYRLDEDGVLEKRCGRCGDYWPADTEFFYCTSNQLSSYCRACNNEHAARHKHAHVPVDGLPKRQERAG